MNTSNDTVNLTTEKKLTLRARHKRMGHQNATHVKKILRENAINFVNENFVCKACVIEKHHKESFHQREERSSKCKEIVFADVCGPM